jgi:glycosyltransferase involved in cell wall biosynthesis
MRPSKITTEKITILYATMARIPGERAHSIQIARMCSALQEMGSDVILISPKRGDKLTRKAKMKDVMEYYGLKIPFMHFKVPVLAIFNEYVKVENLSWFIMAWTLASFTLALNMTLKFFLRKNVYIYVREPLLFITLTVGGWLMKPKIIYEIHELPPPQKDSPRFFWSLMKRSPLIICIAQALSDLVRSRLDNGKERVFTLHDAVDDEIFKIEYSCPEDLASIKKKYRIIMYTGHLDKWKRPEFLIDMMKYVVESDVALVFIGGKEEDISRLRQYVAVNGLNGKVFFLGWRAPAQVPRYLAFADVLVHYSPPGKALSPLKIFEYMLSGRPIAAPRAPGVEEVLKDGINALLFDPLDPADAARKVMLLLRDKELSEMLASNAKNAVLSKYTYRARARTLLDLLKTLAVENNKKQ